MKNYYETLQIVPVATIQEIKDAFRFLLFRYHPDHNKGKEDWAVQQTMGLVEAYHILSDPLRRAHHDVLRTVKVREVAPPKKGLALFSKPSEKTRLAEESYKTGVEKFRGDEYEQAILAFRKAFDADPEYPNLRFNMAVSFLAIERFNDALQWLQDHAGKNKEDLDARALYTKIGGLMSKRKAATG